MQKLITVKNNLSKRFINAKHPKTNNTFHWQYKNYRNMLSKLFKKCKTNYYNQYFKANMNNIKNTCRGITSLITVKNISSDIPKNLPSNGSTINNKPCRNFRCI